MITSPTKFIMCRYLASLFFSSRPSLVDLVRLSEPSLLNHFSVILQSGDSVVRCLAGMIPSTSKKWLFSLCLWINHFLSIIHMEDFAELRNAKTSCWDLHSRWDARINELTAHFVFLYFRPDRGAGWKRPDVRVGSLPADHLLQESRQLQSHPDTIQPPGEQGDTLNT